MGNKPLSFRTCEITQDCNYGWTLENVNKFIDGWSSVKDYAYILHDKDYKEGTTDLREPHIHLMLRFNGVIPINNIIGRAKYVGLDESCITENRIERMHNWGSALNYLTHRDVPLKHKYAESDVICNFDWKLAAETAHQKKMLKQDDARGKQIAEMIFNGTIREYTIFDHLSEWEQLLYDDKIKKAFKLVREKGKLNGERNMKVMFISGPSGVGKDTFAKAYCDKYKLDYYRTNNNEKYLFDDYRGQPAVIWSDARDNLFEPSRLFNLLDNHWKSNQKARYSDINLDCKLMIITSIKPLEEWYKDYFQIKNEPRTQLYRRIEYNIKMDNDYVYLNIYDQEKNAYFYDRTWINKYGHKDSYLSSEEKRRRIGDEVFGEFADDEISEDYLIQDLTNYSQPALTLIDENMFKDIKTID